ncbi:hypothetical protein AB870_12340 [Pandoraea faecigallinarum]|uniref:Uncharacterized protein n=1 Tax=Pandoraea faecigallinarum TaxID=656179 RepID=A0A0H3WSH0_9BURK|nr:hypothetical protein [Pandoraea faecigallinarum]AKM30727.1 hypothetical protein AB870_12340 [Pandoraea faecigallinarum]
MSHAILDLLGAALPRTVGAFVQARCAPGSVPFWLLEYSDGHLTFIVSSAGAMLADVHFGERTPVCEFWMCSPALFESRRVLLMYGSAVRGTRGDIVACVEMFLHHAGSGVLPKI